MNIQTFLVNVLTFLNGTVIPFLLAIAFVFFLWNVVRYFIFGGSDEGKHEEARRLAIWGILAFVVIASLWGIVNTFTRGFGLNYSNSITPDYMGEKGYIPPDDWQPGANLSSGSNSECTIFASDGSCAGAQNIERK